MAKSSIRPKSIDLGALQTELAQAKRDLDRDVRALHKAQDNRDRSRERFDQAKEALTSASRTVLSSSC